MKLDFHFPQILKKLKRGPAVTLPKEIGSIVAYSGIGKESVCIEAGTGSGFLAIALARICKKVYSYERKIEFYELAKKNIESVKIKNIKLKNKDIFQGIDEKKADLVCLDLAEAENVVEHAYKVLKNNGMLTAYLPNIEQAKTFYIKCQRTGFSEVFMLETIEREYKVREYGVRPANIGLMHSGYLVFARK